MLVRERANTTDARLHTGRNRFWDNAVNVCPANARQYRRRGRFAQGVNGRPVSAAWYACPKPAAISEPGVPDVPKHGQTSVWFQHAGLFFGPDVGIEPVPGCPAITASKEHGTPGQSSNLATSPSPPSLVYLEPAHLRSSGAKWRDRQAGAHVKRVMGHTTPSAVWLAPRRRPSYI